MKSALVIGVLFATVLPGCIPLVAPTPALVDSIDMPKASARPLAPGEGVAIVTMPANIGDDEIPACLAKKMQKADPRLRVITAGEVRDELFPWFDRPTTTDSAGKVAAILRRPLVQEKLISLNLGYFITVTEDTSGTPGRRYSDMSANVWDIRAGSSLGTAQVSVSGFALMGMAPIFIVGVWPMTQDRACQELGYRLAAYLTGKQPTGPEPLKGAPTQSQP